MMAASTGHTILVAEDSPTQAERLRLLLEEEGYQVELARSGSEALARTRSRPPDLIISDLVMPGMDGHAFCAEVKASEATRRIPFILFTERNGPGDIIEGLLRGADNFIPKSSPDAYLLERVRRIFEQLEHRGNGLLTVNILLRVGEREISVSADKQQMFELLLASIEETGRVHQELRDAQEQLERHAHDLEAEVARRTREVRETQEQLLQSQKMESVGRLAGGVAHDFNNLLTVITGYGALLAQDVGPGHPGRGRLEQILKAAEQAAALTRQLLAFSRKQVLAPKVLDLDAVVAEVEAMLRRLIGEDIQFVTVAGGGLGRVRADPGQIAQVVVNLAVNARDAMPGGGKLIVETGNVELDESYLRQRPDARAGPHVMLAVSDTGHGMSAETLSQAFEPFFTTKEPGRGTGLGLSTVYGIVRQSGGHVTLYSEPGRGTTCKVYLPRVDEERDAAAEAVAPVAAAPGGTETVLLVEDQAPVRALAREILEAAGYGVLEGAVPEEALAAVAAHPGPIHLLLIDAVLPRISGGRLAAALRATRPETRVLFTSGYTGDAISHLGIVEPGAHFLQKPFTRDGLLRKVREVLG